MQEQIELFPGSEISETSQQRLEIEIQTQVTKLGLNLYNNKMCDYEYHVLTQVQKKLNEYFDNTRLLQTQIKGNVII